MRPKNEDCRDQITLGGGVFVRRAHLQKAQNAAANVIASTLVTKQGAFKAALLAEPAACGLAERLRVIVCCGRWGETSRGLGCVCRVRGGGWTSARRSRVCPERCVACPPLTGARGQVPELPCRADLGKTHMPTQYPRTCCLHASAAPLPPHCTCRLHQPSPCQPGSCPLGAGCISRVT